MRSAGEVPAGEMMKFKTVDIQPWSDFKSHSKFYNKLHAVVNKIEQYQHMINPTGVQTRKMKMFVVCERYSSAVLF